MQGGTLLFRTAEGAKLFTSVMNDQVLFEVDDHSLTEGWSVVVRGTAHVLSTAEEIPGSRAGPAAALGPHREVALRAGHPVGDQRAKFPVRTRAGRGRSPG